MATTDLVRSYLQDIGRHPLLTPEEEVFYTHQVRLMVELRQHEKAIALQLARKPTIAELAFWLNKSEKEIQLIHRRGRIAKNHIATANLRLVVMIARKYQNRNIEFIDLIQEGSLGLYKCIERFEPSRGHKFSTYAYWWIMQGITRAIAQKSRPICLPVYLTGRLNKIKKIQGELSQSLGRSATITEIAQATSLTEKKVIECLRYSENPISFNFPVGEDRNVELGELLETDGISPNEYVDQQLRNDYLKNMLLSLNAVQREVLVLRYGINGKELTLGEVGKRLNLSKERVRQIQSEAIYRLQQKHKGIEFSF
ncbi:MAG: sigma-70 family RNA polymerase sigma factor [Nostoc sp.]|uniref:sigma-70 family RNA polymerase sigma factor n=1 Tax=Nostoc sp. TaxID=1180 RepID=UPI002FFC18EC